jgi:HAD superfamily hydrolase (TIGR01509 family)
MNNLTLDTLLNDPQLAFAEYDGFIFDCDGTLADSMPIHYRAWCAAFAELAPSINFDEPHFYSLGGMPTPEVAETVARKHGVDIDVAAITHAKEAHYLRLISEVKPVAPVVAFARQAKAAGKPVSVATGTMPGIIEKSLETIGLYREITIVITPADVAQGKPAPDMFLLAAKRMGTEPARTLVFEDGPPGFAAATAAGMQYVVVEADKYRV